MHPPPHAPTAAFHTAFLCHLGLSIKNVLSPESRPIKGRIPGRRADKAYLINKSSGIIGARVPRHTLPLISNYPSVSFCQTGRRATARSVIATKRRGVHVYFFSIWAKGWTKTRWHAANPISPRVAHVNKCKWHVLAARRDPIQAPLLCKSRLSPDVAEDLAYFTKSVTKCRRASAAAYKSAASKKKNPQRRQIR